MDWKDRLDQWIRFLMYVLIFWMPYSKAVIETTVIMALVLWIIKRMIGFGSVDKTGMSLRETVVCWIKSFRPPQNKITAPIFIFLGFCLVSSFLSEYSAQAVYGLVSKTCEWFVIYLLVCESFKNRKHINIALSVLTISAVAVALDSFLQYYISHRDIFSGRTISPGSRATGSFEAPSSLGAMFAVILPLFVIIFLDPTRKFLVRMFIIFCGVIFVWSMILSFSRGAMLGVLLSGFFALFVYFYHLKKKKIKAYLCLYLAALVIVLMSKISAGDYTHLGFLKRETSSRILLWDDTFKMIRDRPLFGHGLNTYMKVLQEKYRSKALGKYKQFITYSDYSPTYAHNCYLQLWAEAGLFSLLSFLWILFMLFKNSIYSIKILFNQHDHYNFIAIGLLSGLFAFLSQSFFDTNFYSLQLSSYFWFMAGIQMVINKSTLEQEGTQYAVA